MKGMSFQGLAKRCLAVAMAVFCLFSARGHSKESLHFADQAAVFGYQGSGSGPLHTVCKAVNGVDSALPNMFYKQFKVHLNGHDHRFLGHNLLGESISETSIDYLYGKVVRSGYVVSRTEFAGILGRINARYKHGVIELAQRTLNISRKEATAIVNILHDIHLIGDLTPDNVKIQTIPRLQEIVFDMRRNAANLPFKDKNAYDKFAKDVQVFLDESMKISERKGRQAASEHFLNRIKESSVLSPVGEPSWGKPMVKETGR